MRFRMLVADIDGTLVDRTLRIRDGVRAAVKEAQARGVRVLLATGRIWPSARPFYEALGADPPAILHNGGLVYDFTTGTVLRRDHVPPAHVRTVLSLARDLPGLQPHLYVDTQVYVGRMTPITEAYQRKDQLAVQEVGDLTAFAVSALAGQGGTAAGKILVIGERPLLEVLADRIHAADPAIRHVFSEHIYLEILPPGASKGAALRFVAQALPIPLEEVIAVGDHLNDLEMIEAAGLGVAMADAPEALRARADYVCRAIHEEGLREVVERFLLADSSAGTAHVTREEGHG